MSAINVEQVRESLKNCMDPEVPLSIVDMGLIYGIDVSENNDVNIKMTMTTKGCPLHDTMVDDVKRYAKKRAALKKIIKNKKLELSERFAAQLKLNKLPKNSAKIRIRNRCEVSGRPHGVYRKLKISRIALRDMASSGKIPGITKSSW